MNTIEMNTVELASFEVNAQGRLISGNKRFCRMFGFAESEVQWHYVTDLYRHVNDWNDFRNAAEGDRFEARIKNRKGRSFDCVIIREVFTNNDGEMCFRNVVLRKGEVASVAPATQSRTLVYLARCSHCGTHVRVSNMGETRLRMLCDGCAASAYPEAYHLKEAAAK
ncbi:PAS domain-containing protein [Fibrobacter sp. UWEL]|uniref:PAS domain-containing protein n=1 Tax=Fibrobacter sp. UWEL TaxID=1896209 RepID=UPI00091DFC38|nr:PAS domain-containing protein [Fibrobacter sp. UWEL]SHL12637.1 PAS domain S-box-containing protein [Fibrobacter sp. UWEL]